MWKQSTVIPVVKHKHPSDLLTYEVFSFFLLIARARGCYVPLLEASKTHAKDFSDDFSSAFNTIQLRILVDKLFKKNVDLGFNTVGFNLDLLTERTQRVRGDRLSEYVIISEVSSGVCPVTTPLLLLSFSSVPMTMTLHHATLYSGVMWRSCN